MEPALIISIFALIFSIISITWNIFSDILRDRIKIKRRMFIGEEITDEKGKLLSISAGTKINSLGNKKLIIPKKVFFKIINNGRRDVEVDCIVAEYFKKGESWYFAIREGRYLKPYGVVYGNTENPELKNNIRNEQIKSIYVKDTNGQKWSFPNRDIKEIHKQLALYQTPNN